MIAAGVAGYGALTLGEPSFTSIGVSVLVCHCKAVREVAVRAAIAAGARDEFDVADACGAGTECGGCVPTITRLLDEAGAPCGGGALTGCDLRAALAQDAVVEARTEHA